MRWFLDEDFQPGYLELPAAVRSEEYYVNMMTAWFFATALAKTVGCSNFLSGTESPGSVDA